MPAESSDLARTLGEFVRSFGLHQPGTTPCGQPISTSEAHALTVLSDHDGLRLKDLAAELVLEKSTVSRLVNSLSERGWTAVTRDPGDARARLIHLTDSGRRAADRLADARSSYLEAVLGEVHTENREAVVAALAELSRASRAVREGGSHASTA